MRKKQRWGAHHVLYISKRCNPGHVSVKVIVCCRDLELLAITLPYYLPREFSHVIVLCVYVPLSADAATACD